MSSEPLEPITSDAIEVLESEQLDQATSPVRYEIVTYPADFTLQVLVDKWRKKQIRIPGFQRKYVWKRPQASRLIESFILGLPVPAIFVYIDPSDNSQLVIDGQQRLLSIVYFFEGLFGAEERGRRTEFRLVGLNEASPYHGKSYRDLEESDQGAFNKLNDAVLRAFIIKQLDPRDVASVYHVFERLNTGGTQLIGQEIRNCIYHGKLNDLLYELNANADWRSIYGKVIPENRMRDIELILRFFALLRAGREYRKPMKDFLSRFMKEHRDPGSDELNELRSVFGDTADAVLKHLGEKPFHVRTGLNPAVYDAVFTAFATNLDGIPSDVRDRYQGLIGDNKFMTNASNRTTDRETVDERLLLAREILFG